MKRIVIICLCVISLLSCSKDKVVPQEEDNIPFEKVPHGMIVLGKQLEDPYSVKNMTRALNNLYPTRAERVDITPTDIYVRFLPKDNDEYNSLKQMGLVLMDHPLDYQIITDGDYYHDPSVPQDQITWQYAVVKKGFTMPTNIKYEILDDCFIPDNTTRADDGIDWDAVEREAYRITNNLDQETTPTRASWNKPEGRITIEDKDFAGGKPIGVAGVTVVANRFVKITWSKTDRDGYYKLHKWYKYNVKYRLVFHNEKGFNIGFNFLVIPASMSTLGSGSSGGKDVHITQDSDKTLFTRCVVNNAVYDYYERCQEKDLNIAPPPSGFRIWIFRGLKSIYTVMMRHGVGTDIPLLTKVLGEYSKFLRILLPDVILGLNHAESYKEIYAKAIQCCANASHYRQVGNGYWFDYVKYMLLSEINTGSVFGTGKDAGAGNFEVAQMWSYFIQNKVYNERYGGDLPSYGSGKWFHPELLYYLADRGFTAEDIYSCLGANVVSANDFKKKLIVKFPNRERIINDIFQRFDM